MWSSRNSGFRTKRLLIYYNRVKGKGCKRICRDLFIINETSQLVLEIQSFGEESCPSSCVLCFFYELQRGSIIS
jgi:hypothetical protein